MALAFAKGRKTSNDDEIHLSSGSNPIHYLGLSRGLSLRLHILLFIVKRSEVIQIQVNDYEIVVNSFHISHNLT